MTQFISNSNFKYLSPDDREHLKQDYRHYIFMNGSYYHYIQDTSVYYFNKHLEELTKLHQPITVYINKHIDEALHLINTIESETLF